MHQSPASPFGGAGGVNGGVGVVSPPPQLAPGPGGAMQGQPYARSQAPPRGYAQPSSQASAPVHQQQNFQGTLPPGTRVHVGAITVTVKRYLSQGGFAHVYLVTTEQPIPMPVSSTSAPSSTSSSKRGETTHVLKRMAVPDKETLSLVRSEVEIHRSLRNHPNIISFIEASATNLQGGGYEVFILMEFAAGGGIIDLMNARLRTRLTEREVLKIFGDVANGLSVMHHMDPPLMHRDLKVENILLAPAPSDNPSAGPTYKLCDFGSSTPILSRRAPRSLEEVKRLEADLNRHTTLQYRAPEMVDVYQRRVIDEKADIWAMGVLLYKLCFYTTPFEENGGGPLAILNVQYRFPPMPPYSQKLKNLIASMLQEQSSARPTIDQLILSVHQILGTQPPASALHYAQLTTSGKQMHALPSLVSSSNHMSSAAAADAAAHIVAQRSQPPASQVGAEGIDKNLIAKGPSAAERRRAEEEELKRRSEGITPMRRGRPVKAGQQATATRTPSTATASSFSEAQSVPSAAMMSPNKENNVPDSAQLGFSDSFAPPSKSKADRPSSMVVPSPPPKAVPSLVPAPPSRPTSSTSDLRRRETPLNHSPTLPGFSTPSNEAARISPLPTASKTPKDALAAQDEEASSRYPSVEELDARYASPPPPKASAPPFKKWKDEEKERDQKSPQIASRSRASSNVTIPGLSSRQSLSAIAGKFGGTVSSPVAAPSSSGTTANAASQTPAERSSGSVKNRWNHEVPTHTIAAQSTADRRMPYLTSANVSLAKKHAPAPEGEKPPPALPRRSVKPRDWLTGDDNEEENLERRRDAPQNPPRLGYRSTEIGKEQVKDANTAAESSGDEEEGPEDLDRPSRREDRATPTHVTGNIVSQRLQAHKDSPPTLPAPSRKPTLPLGSGKPSLWNATESKGEDGLHERKKKETVQDQAEMDRMAAEAEKALEKLIGGGSSLDSEPAPLSSDTVMTKRSAPAPAWDEDDEEMQFIAPPALQGDGALISTPLHKDKHAEHLPRVKTYVEASTSPIPSPVTHPSEDTKVEAKATGSKPPVVAPKPLRRSTAHEVAEIMSKYEGLSAGESALPSHTDKVSKEAHMGNSEAPHSSASSNVDYAVPKEPNVAEDVMDRKTREQKGHQVSRAKPVGIESGTVAASGSVDPPPKPQSNKPYDWRGGAGAKPIGTGQQVHLKPWEREAAEKAQVERYGSFRDPDQKEGEAEREESPPAHHVPRKGEAQERFTGVSNLISQWQANAQRGAPGWGTIGGGSATATSKFGANERKKSQDDSSGAIELARSRSTAASSTIVGPSRGSRLAGRDI